jgi:hypothetical protein
MKKFTFHFIFALFAAMAIGTAFGQISVRSSETATTTGTTLTFDKPFGLTVGDVMVVNIVQSDNDGADGGDLSNAVSASLGWTTIDGRQTGIAGSSGDEWWGTVLYKVATASDLLATSFSFTLDGDANGDGSSGGMVVLFNVDISGGVSGTPFAVAPGTINTSSNSLVTTVTATGLSSVPANSGILMLTQLSNDRSHSNWAATSPSSLTEVYDNPFDASLDNSTAAAWAVKTSAGNTGNGTASLSNDARTGAILLAFKSVAAPASANLWATSSSGTQISSYTVLNGAYINGPSNIFAPTFPGGTTGGTSTAALAKSQTPTQATGAFYYLPNTSGNGGVVDIYGASSDGSTVVLVGSIDLNGGGTNSLGFVRIGMGPDGRGWILAGDGTTLYLAKFIPSGANGLGAATVSLEDADGVSLTGTGASVANFQNGDLCLDGQGGIFALANNGSGVTQIYLGAANGNSTTLSLQWTLVDENGDNFSGSVNGVAFDQFGSLYISTSTGLYYINQGTVDGPAGTVQCALVQTQSGLQDLASNFFPAETTLPVTLLSFTGSLRNDVATLNWEVENEINFSHYELERSSSSASGFTSVANKTALGSTGRSNYQHADNLAVVSSAVVYYRLKMVDFDGQFKYSNVIMVRKGEKAITGITINPNPVVSSDVTTVRFSANAPATVAIRVIDMNGKVVLQQQNKVYEGVNSVPVNNLRKLMPGNYVIQLINGVELNAVKFSVVR